MQVPIQLAQPKLSVHNQEYKHKLKGTPPHPTTAQRKVVIAGTKVSLLLQATPIGRIERLGFWLGMDCGLKMGLGAWVVLNACA